MFARRQHVLSVLGLVAVLLFNLVPVVPADAPPSNAEGTVVVHVAFAAFGQYHTVGYVPDTPNFGTGTITCGTGSTCENNTAYGSGKLTCSAGSTCKNDTSWNSTITCQAVSVCNNAAYGNGHTTCPPLVATCTAGATGSAGTKACAAACSSGTKAVLLCNPNATCLDSAARVNGTISVGIFSVSATNTASDRATLACGANVTCTGNAALGTSFIACVDTSTCTGNVAAVNANITCGIGAACKGNIANNESLLSCNTTALCENNHVLGNASFTCNANAWCVNNTVAGNVSFTCGSGAVCRNNTIVSYVGISAAPPTPPTFSRAVTVPLVDSENDWIMDGNLSADTTDSTVKEYCQAQGRSGHSRFIESTGIDFTLHLNGTADCANANYNVTLLVNNHGLDQMEDLCNTQPKDTTKDCAGKYCPPSPGAPSGSPFTNYFSPVGCEAHIRLGNLSNLAAHPVLANFTGFGDNDFGFGYPGEYDATVDTTTSVTFSDVTNIAVPGNPWLVRLDIQDFKLLFTGGPNNPPGGDDWNIDARVNATDGSCSSLVRTMHSRFIQPSRLDLLIRNATGCENQTLDLHVVPYTHLFDSFIDVNGDATGTSGAGTTTCDASASCSSNNAWGSGIVWCGPLTTCKSATAFGNGNVTCLAGSKCENDTAPGYSDHVGATQAGPCPPQIGPNATTQLPDGRAVGTLCDISTQIILTDGWYTGTQYANGTYDSQADSNDGNLTYNVSVLRAPDVNTTHIAFLLTPDIANDPLENDWLLDGQATTSDPVCHAEWRTSHSRYYPPRGLDLT
ncbi:MAG: hypothetical protein LC624_06290, partial [Halobacteriales archaeon]|nr:hypothetical protein [Halobacteriales archaeon]